MSVRNERMMRRTKAILGTVSAIALLAAPVNAQDRCHEAMIPQPGECARSNGDIVVRMPAGEATERVRVSPGPGFSETGFSISLDGETIAGADAPRDTQRPADLEAEATDIDIRFDRLERRRMLNVATVDLRSAYRAGDGVTFRASANYPAFIARGEVRITDPARSGRTVAVLPVPPNGQVAWTMPEDVDGELAYVFRVYDAEGRYDETGPLPLVRVDDDLATHRTVRGEVTAPGEGEDRTVRRGIPVRGGVVAVAGREVPPGATVTVMGEAVPVDPTGKFVTSRVLPVGAHAVDVRIADAFGTRTITRDVEIPRADWFAVGIADLTFGKRLEDDLASADPGYEETFIEGRLGYFGDGYLANGARVTVSVDTGEGDIEDVFRRLDDKDPRKVLQRLDPEDGYPTFGDDSSAFDAAPTSGRVFLRVEHTGKRFTWGDFRAKFDDTALLNSSRALYGAEAAFTSQGVTDKGQPRTEAFVYAAEPDTLPQRDILRGSGGSVYFLSRQDINGGSETVAIQVRDPDTGRIVSTQTLQPGIDYDLDYIQGVIILASPLSSSTSDGNIIGEGSSGAFDLNLVVQYEYTPALDNVAGAAVGGRVSHWVTDDLRLGFSALREETGFADQRVLGADLRWEIGENSLVEIEVAQTEGPGFDRALSSDGGLTIDAAGTGSGDRANALRFDTRLDFDDLGFERAGFLDLYYHRKDAGFSTLNEDVTEDETLIGLNTEVDMTDRLSLGMSAEDFSASGGEDRSETELRFSYDLTERLEVTGAIGRVDRVIPGEPDETGERTVAALRFDYELANDLDVFVFGQTTLSRSGGLGANDRIGAGFDAELGERVSLSAEVSDGTLGTGAKAELSFRPTPDQDVYLGYTLDPERVAPASGLEGSDGGIFVVGGRFRHSDQLSSYGEDRWDLWGDRRSVTRGYGVNYAPDAQWTLSADLETGTVRDDINGDFDRTAVSLGAAYADEDLIDGRLRLEWREEDGQDPSQDRETWALLGGFSYKVSDDWRFVAGVDALMSESDQSVFLDGDYVEASLGYAYRPVENERLNLLFRYTYLEDLPGPDQVTADGTTGGDRQRSHVLSVDGIYDLTEKLSLGAKYGVRKSEIAPRGTNAFTDSTAHLGILRFDWHVVHKWDVLAEGRVLASGDTDVTELGGLLGVYRHVGNNLRVGVGYEAGRVSDDVTDLDYDARGVFLNIVGKF